MARKITLIGKRFGRLVATTRIPRKKTGGRVGYLCDCDCGTKGKYVQDSNLISGGVQSCGCLKLEELKARGMDKRQLRLNEIGRYYRKNAKDRGFTWTLSQADLEQIITKPCYYCGTVGDLGFDLNGIDRVDNNQGYLKDNVVSCCTTCNRAKMQMSTADFLAWIKQVYEHQKGEPSV